MKKLLFALPVVLLLAAGCSSKQPVVENQPNNTQPTQTQQTTPPPANTQVTPTPTPSQNSDVTANWKTYTNTTWGFSLKYPSEYKVGSINDMKKQDVLGNVVVMQISDPKDKSIEFGPSLNVTITKQPYDVSGKIYNNINDFVNQALKPPGSVTKQQIKIGGYDAVKIAYLNQDGPVTESTSIWLMKDQWLYTITYSPTNYKYFAEVAGSFKFTK